LRLFRRVIVFLTVAAYLAVAGLMPGMAGTAADVDKAAHFAGSGMDGPLPCEERIGGCFTAAGCIFLTGVPARLMGFAIPTAWSSIAFHPVVPVLHGRTLAPALDPPISHA
jgi:hypothetical protein